VDSNSNQKIDRCCGRFMYWGCHLSSKNLQS